ncbi:ead/Ea22-like family protein [Citrobacter freundii]|uniref:ead/Ea22-like family protein n=1 Tax=Citrobacter freundii TaxID=546 RepID=UPI003A8781EE
MTALNKQALREAEIRAGGVNWIYIRTLSLSNAYITEETGATVIDCTAGDVPAKCAGFLELANPATVLALLDELEAAQKLATQQGNIAVALLDEVTTLRRNANDNVPEQRECLEAAEKRIAELEAREVELPKLKMLSDYLAEVTQREREDILVGVKLEFHRMLTAAGIGVKGK